jgi:lipopolysaccharide export LptBFGC system permease protein LptF
MDLFQDEAVRQFLIQVVTPIILIVIGIGMLLRSRRSDYGEVMQTTVISIIALVFIVGGTALMAVGERAANALF